MLSKVSNINISQGSVATFVRCGGILNDSFISNLPASLAVKEFWKSTQRLAKLQTKVEGLTFLGHPVHATALGCADVILAR